MVTLIVLQAAIMVVPALVACWFVLRDEKKRLAETSRTGQVMTFPAEGGTGAGERAA